MSLLIPSPPCTACLSLCLPTARLCVQLPAAGTVSVCAVSAAAVLTCSLSMSVSACLCVCVPVCLRLCACGWAACSVCAGGCGCGSVAVALGCGSQLLRTGTVDCAAVLLTCDPGVSRSSGPASLLWSLQSLSAALRSLCTWAVSQLLRRLTQPCCATAGLCGLCVTLWRSL